jgi:hypothetical protein
MEISNTLLDDAPVENAVKEAPSSQSLTDLASRGVKCVFIK